MMKETTVFNTLKVYQVESFQILFSNGYKINFQ